MNPSFGKISSKIEHLVVDSGGFIKHVELQSIGSLIYSLPEVISEIKDRNTKERLAVLPYEIHFKEPTPELIKRVSDFAKKTGDYAALSATDIKVIALTLMLEKEHQGGLDHIHEEPRKAKTVIHNAEDNASGETSRGTTIPGFFLPKDAGSEKICSADLLIGDGKKPCEIEPIQLEIIPSKDPGCIVREIEGLHLSDDGHYSNEDGWESEVDVSDVRDPSILLIDGACDTAANDDDEGWITPRNIKEVYKQMGIMQEEPMIKFQVACLTTDFSMQNVMMQMGLHVVSADGMLIKSLRIYVLRCFACFKVTHSMEKKFCPSCGNSTLKRVCCTTDKNGNQKYHISTKRPLNIRGTKFSLPLPKGGKHAVNPILCEDQPQPHFKSSKKSLQKLNVFDPDYAARDSPFLMNDLTSRASLLGQRGNAPFAKTYAWMSRNPNAVKRPKK